MRIDVAFDLRTDTYGSDTDKDSETLRQYHKALWSKRLPSGAMFALSDTPRTKYLHHRSALGEFRLSSDAIVPSYTTWGSLSHIIRQLSPAENEAFDRLVYSIGGRLIFPGNKIDGLPTINQDKAFGRNKDVIADRLDLTLECIRRHYAGPSYTSPLGPTLARYADFFELFGDFEGYVRFFLLDDLVTDSMEVKFALEFDDFATAPAWPQCLAAYKEYRHRSMEFLEARNRRIARLQS